MKGVIDCRVKCRERLNFESLKAPFGCSCPVEFNYIHIPLAS